MPKNKLTTCNVMLGRAYAFSKLVLRPIHCCVSLLTWIWATQLCGSSMYPPVWVWQWCWKRLWLVNMDIFRGAKTNPILGARGHSIGLSLWSHHFLFILWPAGLISRAGLDRNHCVSTHSVCLIRIGIALARLGKNNIVTACGFSNSLAGPLVCP